MATLTSDKLYSAERKLSHDWLILAITFVLMIVTPAALLAAGAVLVIRFADRIPAAWLQVLFAEGSWLRWLVPAVLVLAIALGIISPLMVWVERRVLSLMQSRLGPNRVGPFGLFQPLADTLKLISKEDIIPDNASKFIFKLAPCLVLFPALAGWVVIPMGPIFEAAGTKFNIFQMSDLSVGILYVFAISSLGVLGVVLGGWASGSKYPLLGSLRSTNQMLSYEVPLGLSVLGVLMITGAIRPDLIVNYQNEHGLWNVVPQFPAFLLFVVAGIAETNRVPFDLAEAEAELTAGFHTEYSGFRFAAFFMAEYLNMWMMSCLATLLFLGGWLIPGQGLLTAHTALGAPGFAWLLAILQAFCFIIKAFSFMFVFVWIRSTIPRYRYDQLMNLGWKLLIPLALWNLIWTAFAAKFGFLVGIAVAIATFLPLYRFLDRHATNPHTRAAAVPS